MEQSSNPDDVIRSSQYKAHSENHAVDLKPPRLKQSATLKTIYAPPTRLRSRQGLSTDYGQQLSHGSGPREEGNRGTVVVSEDNSVCTVSSTADSGAGTLRWCLETSQSGYTIDFDPLSFPPENPVAVQLANDLPGVTQGNLTIDASNAGVILDGKSSLGTGLYLNSDGNVVRGLQIEGFLYTAISVNGDYNIIGGNRELGTGPIGQGNRMSNNAVGIGLLFG